MNRSEGVFTELGVLVQISQKLDRLIAVLAVQGKEKNKQIEIMAAAGLDSTFIASILGTTAGTIRNTDAWRRSKNANSGPRENRTGPDIIDASDG